jgi:hypothetical protein
MNQTPLSSLLRLGFIGDAPPSDLGSILAYGLQVPQNINPERGIGNMVIPRVQVPQNINPERGIGNMVIPRVQVPQNISGRERP